MCPAPGGVDHGRPGGGGVGSSGRRGEADELPEHTDHGRRYPDVAVLNGRRQPVKATVARGTSYLAIDPGPARIRLNTGETALAAIAWPNTVEVAEDKVSGTYLAIAPRLGEPRLIWPADTDLGTTARVALTAWRRKLPN
ncbi:DUF4232 domain-containing protein [Kribbella aluminosa]|uniref:DUF4232 domain-containing protein n=1 Tax=Kribbella aluminosa TaxID=416017 RepID=UPI0031DB594B